MRSRTVRRSLYRLVLWPHFPHTPHSLNFLAGIQFPMTSTPYCYHVWVVHPSPLSHIGHETMPRYVAMGAAARGSLKAIPVSPMMMMILAYMAFCEVSQDQSAGAPAAAGDFGFKVLTASDPEEKTKKLNAELANGRLAMMAIIGVFFQDGLTGSAWGDWANYTASPLRAFVRSSGPNWLLGPRRLSGVEDPLCCWLTGGGRA